MLTIGPIQQKHKNGIHQLIGILNKTDKLAYSLTDEWLDYMIQEKSESIFVAIHQEKLLGIATCMINETDASHAVLNIAVHPDCRNQGVGTKLYDQAMHYMKEKNIKIVESYVKKRLKDSLSFAKKRGFNSVLYAWQMDLDVGKGKQNLMFPQDAALVFRQATLKDNHTYASIINHTFGDTLDQNVLSEMLKDPSIRVYMLEKEGQVIGSATVQLRTNLSLGYIYDVAITDQYRGQGFGTYLLGKCIEELYTFGIATASLTVTGQNKRALGLYHKLGFEEVDTDIILQRVKNFKN